MGTVMSLPTLFGIPNCDTVRKARKWLDSQGIAHDFVDLRENTPPVRRSASWLESVGDQVQLKVRRFNGIRGSVFG